MKKINLYIVIIFCSVLLSGCSVFMAANQPPKLNTELFKAGVPRDQLLAEFGVPAVSEERDGKKVEIYRFTQGYGAGAKTGRALFHGAADLFTLGIWEIVGTPTEAVFDGTEMAYQVTYDQNNVVENVIVLKHK